MKNKNTGLYYPDNIREKVFDRPDKVIYVEIWEYYTFNESIELEYRNSRKSLISELDINKFTQLGNTLSETLSCRIDKINFKSKDDSKFLISKEEFELITNELLSIKPITLSELYEIYKRNGF